MRMRWFAGTVFILGIGLILYPFVQDLYGERQQHQLLDRLEAEGVEDVSLEGDMAGRYDALNAVLDEGAITESTTRNASVADQALLGKISIPSIELELPIVNGATEDNLKYAVGRLSGTGMIGEDGNTALAAHRGYSHGELFNRLDEVQTGDDISINAGRISYKYTVRDTFLVLPTNLSVLDDVEDTSVITLITCDPGQDPTHRLIVRAELIEKKDNS
ncbi:class D sortase [Pontibacillus salicampi]|uniref:Class D sortase n=1 Tax=Pontibacillus salicampi TaxID=1449801 RepID=A0ABV6LPI8_9BACI